MEGRGAAGGRDPAFDVARGIAILMIVLGHVLRGLSAADLLDPATGWYEEVDTLLYLVHLPVFMFVSGLFLARSAAHGRSFLAGRLLTLTYLFVLWTAIQGAVKVAAGSLANDPVSARDLVTELWKPDSQLWFLPTLAAMTVAVVSLAPWRGTARFTATTALALVCVGLWGIFGTWAGTQGWALFLAFAAGVLIGAQRAGGLLRMRWVGVTGVVLVGVYLTVALLTEPTPPSDEFWPRNVASVALGVVATVCGTIGVLAVSSVIGGRLRTALAFLGRHSLEIFVAHIVFTAGTRIVLEQVGILDPAAQAVAGLGVGVGGPLFLALVAEQAGWKWLFGPPKRRTTASAVQ